MRCRRQIDHDVHETNMEHCLCNNCNHPCAHLCRTQNAKGNKKKQRAHMCHFSQKPHNKLCCGGEDLRYLIASGKLEQAGRMMQKQSTTLPVSASDRRRGLTKGQPGPLSKAMQPRPHSSHSLRPPTDTNTAQRLSLTPPPPPPPPCSPSVIQDKPNNSYGDFADGEGRSRRSDQRNSPRNSASCSAPGSVERVPCDRAVVMKKERLLSRTGSDGSVQSSDSNSPANELNAENPFSDESDHEHFDILAEQTLENVGTKIEAKTCEAPSSPAFNERSQSSSQNNNHRANGHESGSSYNPHSLLLTSDHRQRRAQTRGCTLRSMFGCWANGRDLPPLAPSALAAGGFERPSSAGSFSADDERSPAKKTRHSCRPDKPVGCREIIRKPGAYCSHCTHSSPSSNGSGTTRTALAPESPWPAAPSSHSPQPLPWKNSSSSRMCSTRQSVRSCDCGSDLCSEPRSFGGIGSRPDVIRATNGSIAGSVTSAGSSLRTTSERNVFEPTGNVRTAFDSPDRSTNWLQEPQARGLSASPQASTVLETESVDRYSLTLNVGIGPKGEPTEPSSEDFVEQLHQFQLIYAANQASDLDHKVAASLGSDSNNNHHERHHRHRAETNEAEDVGRSDQDVVCQQHQAASTVQAHKLDCPPCPTPVSST
jgi:hypothetical protein